MSLYSALPRVVKFDLQKYERALDSYGHLPTNLVHLIPVAFIATTFVLPNKFGNSEIEKWTIFFTATSTEPVLLVREWSFNVESACWYPSVEHLFDGTAFFRDRNNAFREKVEIHIGADGKVCGTISKNSTVGDYTAWQVEKGFEVRV